MADRTPDEREFYEATGPLMQEGSMTQEQAPYTSTPLIDGYSIDPAEPNSALWGGYLVELDGWRRPLTPGHANLFRALAARLAAMEAALLDLGEPVEGNGNEAGEWVLSSYLNAQTARIAELETALWLTHDALGDAHDALGEVLSTELHVDWPSLPELTGNTAWAGLKDRLDAAWEAGKASLAARDGAEG